MPCKTNVLLLKVHATQEGRESDGILLHAGVSVKLRSGETVRGRIIVGADGARSAVAAALNMAVPSYAGYSAYR